MRWKPRLFLVKIDRDDVKVNRGTGFELEQDIQHAVAVFAARHADHHLIAFFNHIELNNGLAHLTAQALF